MLMLLRYDSPADLEKEIEMSFQNVSHWHGASVDSHFVQVAVTGREKGETVWLHEVTDEKYRT